MNQRNTLPLIVFLISLISLTIVPSVYSEDAEVHFLLGRGYLLEGNEVDALKEFDKAKAVGNSPPLFKGGPGGVLSKEYYNAGVVLIKNPKKAHIGLHYLNNYLYENKEKGPELASLLHAEGLNMISSNKYMAHGMLKKALELKPEYENNEEFYFAYDVRSANKPNDVIKGGEDFVARFPKSSYVPQVLYTIGEAHYSLQKPSDGRKFFKETADKFPDTEWGKKAGQRLK